jgi:anti-sigma regulatory factor (Ser/Thr protein kinase)
MIPRSRAVQPEIGFCHQAVLYRGQEELLRVVERFLLDGSDAGDALAVLMNGRGLDSLRRRFGSLLQQVRLSEFDELGGNPAFVIPFWRGFGQSLAARQRGRGVSEPISVAPGSPVSSECKLHESLVNLAFTEGPPLWLLCPYDSSLLDHETLDYVYRCHPFVSIGDGACTPNDRFVPPDLGSSLTGDLVPAPVDAKHWVVDVDSIAKARQTLSDLSVEFGLDLSSAMDLALAAHEVIANSVRYGGGRADVAVWQHDGALVCEIRDSGHLDDPLAGRTLPGDRARGGRGLWIANQLCGLVQMRSVPEGTVVRLHMRQRS